MNETRLLTDILPSRMHAVATLNRALELRARWCDAPAMTIFVDGRLEIEGNFDVLTNPAMEAGLVPGCAALSGFVKGASSLSKKRFDKCGMQLRIHLRRLRT